MRMLRDKRGISPVITTVIIVAVGITIAIAVALWMTGLIGAFMGYEKVEIRSAFPAPNSTSGGDGWDIYLSYINTGSTPTKIDNVFINNVPYDKWKVDGKRITLILNNISINLPWDASIGKMQNCTITIPSGSEFANQTLVSGVTIEIKLHSTGGKEYFTSVVLP